MCDPTTAGTAKGDILIENDRVRVTRWSFDKKGDRTGWHRSDSLTLPRNLSIILLPPRSPELNPVENIWQYLRQNWLSNRVFEDYDTILDAGCEAWKKITAQPQTIMSIGMRDWAHKSQ